MCSARAMANCSRLGRRPKRLGWLFWGARKPFWVGERAFLVEAIFEVQVLLALERAAAPHQVELRVPRCIAYKARVLTNPSKSIEIP